MMTLNLDEKERSNPTASEALTQLRSFQKPSSGTPMYSRYVNRPVGRYFAALAASRGISPNAISMASGGLSAVAIALVALLAPSTWLGVGIAVLLVIAYALDSADGQVARLTGTNSVLGEWLDHMIDCAKISALHVAVAWHVVQHTDLDSVAVAVPLVSAVIAAVLFFGIILTDQLRRSAGLDRATTHVRPDSSLRSLATLPTDFGVLCLSFLFFGSSELFLGAYAMLMAGSAVLLVAALGRWVAILRSIDADGHRA